MINEKMREEFEAWAKPHLIYGDDSEDIEGFDMRMECAYYIRTETQSAWEAWQASRAAIEVELPIAHGAPRNSTSYQEGLADGFERAIYRAEEAIKALGLKVKP